MLGILCGLEVEAALARKVKDARVGCAAARPQQARWAARELMAQGATKLLSFGLAGGLEPGLPAGTIIIGTGVQAIDAQWQCDEAWVADLRRRLPGAHCGPVWGSEVIITRARDKRSCYEKSRCLATDMESHAVAQIAAEANVPFAVLRVVADTDAMDVPPAALVPLRGDGRVDLGRVLWNLSRHPGQLRGLIALGLHTRKAMKMLGQARNGLN
jgi:adenosylhomocysteine nucleosidase